MSFGDFDGPLDVLVQEVSSGGLVPNLQAQVQQATSRVSFLQSEVDRLKREAATVTSQASSLLGLAGDPSKLVEYVEIESNYGPRLRINGPLAPSNPSDTSTRLLQELQPRMTIKIQGMAPWVVEPYGRPGETKWPWVAFGLGAVVGAAGGGVLFGRLGAIGGGVAGGVALRALLK